MKLFLFYPLMFNIKQKIQTLYSLPAELLEKAFLFHHRLSSLGSDKLTRRPPHNANR